jgi:hypothetical protein
MDGGKGIKGERLVENRGEGRGEVWKRNVMR